MEAEDTAAPFTLREAPETSIFGGGIHLHGKVERIAAVACKVPGNRFAGFFVFPYGRVGGGKGIGERHRARKAQGKIVGGNGMIGRFPDLGKIQGKVAHFHADLLRCRPCGNGEEKEESKDESKASFHFIGSCFLFFGMAGICGQKEAMGRESSSFPFSIFRTVT